ncbi:MAG: AmmeMemoRadiSam system protein B [Desulfamplus sp.]|nr:AmmeMemoRadiSam system protein B [Desulfamplus sp.]
MKKSAYGIKKAAFSGSWYPDDPEECTKSIEKFLREGDRRIKSLNGLFSGGVVPHAGWFFSGSIACGVIASIASSPFLKRAPMPPLKEDPMPSLKEDPMASLKADPVPPLKACPMRSFMPHGEEPSAEKVDAVVIFGMHMHPHSQPCTMVNGCWETPLGKIPVHGALAGAIAKQMEIRQDSPLTFPEENTIELQLPFIKYFFPDAAIVPVGVPPSNVAESMGRGVVSCADELGINIVVLGSTDMTHYGDSFGFSPAGSGNDALKWVTDHNDRKAIQAMLEMDAGAIVSHGLTNRSLCCAGAVSAAVSAVKKMGAVKGVEFDYAISHDKSPGKSFVGYSGILFAH